MIMGIKHAVTKTPGQKVFAVADWNANHVITSHVDWQGFNLINVGLLQVNTSVTVGTMTIAGGSITDTTGLISFGNETLRTTGRGEFGTLLEGFSIAADVAGYAGLYTISMPSGSLMVQGTIEIGGVNLILADIARDATNSVLFWAWSYWDPVAPSSYERMEWGWNELNNEFSIYTRVLGPTSTPRDINIYTFGHHNQLLLSFDGFVGTTQRFYHVGDTDTYMNFGTDIITFFAGGVEFLRLREGPADALTINALGRDVDTIIEGDTNPNLFFVNAGTDRVGIGTSAPQGLLHVGDQATNYAKFAPDGELTLHGTARVERHMVIGAPSWKKGAVAPGESFVGIFPVLDFADAKQDAAHYSTQVPYRWDNTTDIAVSIMWKHDTVAKTGKVLWKLTYIGIEDGEDPAGAGVTIAQLSAGNHPQDQQITTLFVPKMLAANLANHDSLGLKVWRDGTDGTDTLTEAARLIEVHIHFIENKLGQPT